MTRQHQRPDLLDTDAVLERVAARLADTFAGTFSAETVERYVFESYVALYRTASVRHHLTALAEHFATDRLTALAQARGDLAKPVPEVLFLCVANTGRSQMAAALLTHRAGGRVHARSAGSLPGHDLEAPAVEAMREVGIDITGAYPKPVTDDVIRAADVIITMGCGDACPVLPGKRYLDWPIADPAGAALPDVRDIRDDIDTRVCDLITELTGPRA